MERRKTGLQSARIAAFRHSPLSLEGTFTSDGPALADFGADPARVAVAAGERREVLEAIALLPARQRKVIALHYYNRDLAARDRGTAERFAAARLAAASAALERLRGLLAAP